MQQELQITLLIIGGLFIIGVLAHGFWSIRKNNKRLHQSNYETRKNWEPTFSEDDEEIEYDDVVISSARVIDDPVKKSTPSAATTGTEETLVNIELPTSKPSEPDSLESASADDSGPSALSAHTDDKDSFVSDEVLSEDSLTLDEDHLTEKTGNTENADETFSSDYSNADVGALTTELEQADTQQNQDAPIYSGVVTQPKPEFVKNKVEANVQDESIPEPPGFLLKKAGDVKIDDTSDSDLSDKRIDDELATDKPKKPEAPRPDFSLDAESFEQPTVQTTKTVKMTENDKPKKDLSLAEQAKRFVRRNKKTVADKIRKDPVIDTKKSTDDQMRIDFDESPSANRGFSTERSRSAEEKPVENERATTNGASEKTAPASDVLILNVQTPSDNPIAGAALLPMLLTLGFKFGEHDIFHRHVNTNGKGPILFSLTNMFKPGVFDIDNMENFSTQGVALFMMLPIDGDAQQVFNMMHNAARKISEEFGGKILDGNKVPISKQSLQQYAERIREFERRKLSQ
ncbi:cell division protein ZipA [Agaribacter marinus]|uniref:Cell division protein ZipA n=1 Tax=Agaribacter marinus TaxID=1431249 RepID=A0AA37SVT9_9ALTE|nr:cell division protein ZipA [Agaribacter marinus]GLR70468.1 hypothetical protein GCM10007852_13760 [Agaribacter marinus]